MPVTDTQIEELEQALTADSFKTAFDADPVAAARQAGYDQVADQFQHWLANPDQLQQQFPDVEAHWLPDKSTQTRLLLLLATSATIATTLANGRAG